MTPIEKQTVLITGATDGLGKGIALDLARRGATVIVHGRDPARIAQTVDEVKRVSKGGVVRSVEADFASLDAVRAMATELAANEPRIDALINNAGIGTVIPPGGRAESKDGHELRFAVNYLAPYLLTRMLLPTLRASAPARVINVSSAGQRAIEFDDVMLRREYNGVRAYCQSKLAQILFTIDLGDELRIAGVTVNALHPSTYMPTKIVESPMSTLKEGVDATVRLVIDPALDTVSGQYFDVLRESRANAQAYDKVARQKLRALSTELTGVGGEG
jgi:NAD(P)-dependent dehydrogenase (short-subunit alcohol dehydrogenase family)